VNLLFSGKAKNKVKCGFYLRYVNKNKILNCALRSMELKISMNTDLLQQHFYRCSSWTKYSHIVEYGIGKTFLVV